MEIKDTIKMSFAGLTTHKSRSMLTILGIVIGITSIILVMSLGQSAQKMIVDQVEGLGSTTISVIPGRQPKGMSDGMGALLQDSLKEKDFQDLQKKNLVPNASAVGSFVFTQAVVSYNSDTYSTTVLGGSPGFFDMFKLEVAEGNPLTDEDVAQKSDSVVVGKKVADELFGQSNPIGERLKIKEKSYHIVGILSGKGSSPFMNFDDSVIIPVSTVQTYIMGIKYYQRLIVVADSPDNVDTTVEDIKSVLRANHNITDSEKDDFYIQTQADMIKTIGSIMGIMTALLSSVAAISLIVGGVGIMNIMYVSVTERTREIGLRKALGATNKDILAQFLAEAVVLTLAGGVIGILLGTILGYVATIAINELAGLGFPFAFSYLGAILGVLVSSVIGFVFGIFPAKRASQKSPIEALRYE